MGYDLGRAVLAVCSVLAVLIAASAFPAAGFGTLPGGGAGPGQGAGPGGDGPPTAGGTPTTGPGAPDGDGPDGTTDGTTGEDPDGTTGEDPDVTTDGEPGDSTDTTTTTTTTTTSTTTEPTTTTTPPATDGDDDGGLAALAVLSALLWGLLVALGAVLTVGIGLLGVGMAMGVVAFERAAGLLVLRVAGHEFRVGRAFQGTSRATMSYVLALSASTARLVDDFGAALRGAVTGIGPALSALGRTGGLALTGLPRAFGAALAGTTRALGGVLLALPSGLGAIAGGLGSPGRSGSTPDRDARDASPVPPSEDAAEEPTPPGSVEEAWAAFVEELAVRNSRSKTPREFARIAVDGGLPAEAVRRLTRVFREVRYGGFPPSDDRLRAALSALEEIRGRGGEES